MKFVFDNSDEWKWVACDEDVIYIDEKNERDIFGEIGEEWSIYITMCETKGD